MVGGMKSTLNDDQVAMPALMPAPELLAADLPARKAILDPILSKKSLTMVYGPRGLGKTHVALGIAWAAASGQSFLKWTATRPHRVVYVDGEMAAVDLQARLRQFGSAPPDLNFLIADLNPKTVMADLIGTAGQVSLMRAWGRQPELLVLDNLSSLMGLRGNSADRWGEVQHWLAIMRRAGMAVLMLHHANKDGDQRGTSQREDALDVVMSMRPPSDHTPQQGARFELHFEKARGLHGDAVEPIEAWVETDIVGTQRWKWQPLEQSTFDKVMVLLRRGLKPLEIARETGVSKSQVYRIREKAASADQLATIS